MVVVVYNEQRRNLNYLYESMYVIKTPCNNDRLQRIRKKLSKGGNMKEKVPVERFDPATFCLQSELCYISPMVPLMR